MATGDPGITIISVNSKSCHVVYFYTCPICGKKTDKCGLTFRECPSTGITDTYNVSTVCYNYSCSNFKLNSMKNMEAKGCIYITRLQ
jgi:hypothetical protein